MHTFSLKRISFQIHMFSFKVAIISLVYRIIPLSPIFIVNIGALAINNSRFLSKNSSASG